MRLRLNVALQQTGRLLMKRASRALLLIALQLNLSVSWHQTWGADGSRHRRVGVGELYSYVRDHAQAAAYDRGSGNAWFISSSGKPA
jgi:hypothetical protein